MPNKCLIALAIVLIAGYARAIPETELDWNDRYLINKIINGSIVVDIPESKKRQGGTVAILCDSENVGCLTSGNSILFQANTGVPLISNFGVSSARLFDDNYVLILYSGAGYTGEARVFRTKKPINKMADQGNFNDKAKSARVIYAGPIGCSANLWEGPNFSRRVEYVTCGSYTQMAGSAAYAPDGFQGISIGDNTLSSFEVAPLRSLQLFTDTNFGGTASGYQPWISQAGVYYEVAQVNVANCGIAENTLSSFILG